MLKILTFSSLFPNPNQPSHGIFVAQRLRQLLTSGEVEARVVAPVPMYPSWLPGYGNYGVYKGIPARRTENGVEVLHPRYPVIPKIGMTVAPYLMAAAVRSAVTDLYTGDFRFDLIDAHYFYPDGVAAGMIARQLGVPFVITSRGTDISLIPNYALPRRQILRAAADASALITVCDALRDELIELGVEAGKVTTLRNGVDPAIFHPVDRTSARAELGISERTLLSVGHLIERKGHHLSIEAMTELSDYRLVIVGTGEEEQRLKRLAETLGVSDRVRFDGAIPQPRLRTYYSACDAFVLASSREGMANVLLESISCGCPVVATRIWGTPEVIRSREAGVLVGERTGAGLAAAVRQLFADMPGREETHSYSKNYLWGPTTTGQLEIFRAALASAQESG